MPSSLSRLTELRRGLPIIAAGLLILALVFPMWRITLTAPQYPGQALVVELYAYPRLSGDYLEVDSLNQYVGFYYPDPVYIDPHFPVHDASIKAPEWILGPVAFVAVSAAGVFVAFAPTIRKLKVGLTAQLIGTITVFTVMFALIQYRLYQAGHSLDPNAPLRGVDSFTPPVLGGYEVANISGFAWFGPGGYLTVVAIVLLLLSFVLRDNTATFRDIPSILQTRGESLKETVEHRQLYRIRLKRRL